jgi:hypothetical protein
MSIDRQSLTGTGIDKTSTFKVVSSGVTLVVDAGGKLGSGRMAGRGRRLCWWLSACQPVTVDGSPGPSKPRRWGKENRHRLLFCFFVDRTLCPALHQPDARERLVPIARRPLSSTKRGLPSPKTTTTIIPWPRPLDCFSHLQFDGGEMNKPATHA